MRLQGQSLSLAQKASLTLRGNFVNLNQLFLILPTPAPGTRHLAPGTTVSAAFKLRFLVGCQTICFVFSPLTQDIMN